MPKYMLMFVDDQDAWETFSQAERDAAYQKIGEWWGQHSASGKIVGGEELEHKRTAKTVRFDGTKATVTDGPFLEAKETVGGYALVEVADQSEAIELAKTWPGRSTVEVRPIVDHSGSTTA